MFSMLFKIQFLHLSVFSASQITKKKKKVIDCYQGFHFWFKIKRLKHFTNIQTLLADKMQITKMRFSF